MSNGRQVIGYGQTRVGSAIDGRLKKWKDDNTLPRVWEVDPTVWSDDPDHKAAISQRLGWLTSAEVLYDDMDALVAFVGEVREQFTHVVLLGMGGSSLAPEVYSMVLGTAQGYPQFRVLDSTDPGAVREVESWCNLPTTLFIVASKSGGTVETRVLGDYFFERVQAIKGSHVGENFVAITDQGSGLDKDARALGYRRVFLNIATIGGRYSALSLFGLVPAALMGVDVKSILDQARAMMTACGPGALPEDNPGALLGAALGELALIGRDKVTFLFPPHWASFGNWAEQLIAESTGKGGKGLVPVALETPGQPEVYGADRVFVTYEIPGGPDEALAQAISVLEEAGYPVIRISLAQPGDLGCEYFRWCFATAMVGEVLGINPFDQPNVRESKTNTAAALKAYEETGDLPSIAPALEINGLKLYGNVAGGDLASALRSFLGQVRPADYVALQAYVMPDAARWQVMESIRLAIRDTLKVATTAAYGPRFLHSTGQLHKGGPPTGVFIQLTSDHGEDVKVAARPYSFGTLIDAQALGDWRALTGRDLRVLRVHLGADVVGDLNKLLASVQAALE